MEKLEPDSIFILNNISIQLENQWNYNNNYMILISSEI